MFDFHIQTDGPIPPSQQLIEQIQFAIATGKYPPGARLPSTRQLASLTRLHRNTISKVYKTLKKLGLVEAIPGSGIYVKKQECDKRGISDSPRALVRETIDRIIQKGHRVEEVQQWFLEEIQWRLACREVLVVSLPQSDLGTGKLIVTELEPLLARPIHLIAIEGLANFLWHKKYATVITSRYFFPLVRDTIPPHSALVIPIDIYDYQRELDIIRQLPPDSYLGIVSVGEGILRAAHILIHSLRGDDISVITATADNPSQLEYIVRYCDLIICDPPSYLPVREIYHRVSPQLLRPSRILKSNCYISKESIELLKRELGL
ncbi:MAG: GntR family transcriptional regulator [Geminocystis sp.]|nr:GntR family transcriptional regulator [Geminocystis sp.]HIK37294.1 GntR family transcriptional regulator [Geminocystis sp. M7585_C2015_104]